MANPGTRAYNGSLGAEHPTGFRGRLPGQGITGAKPPEAERRYRDRSFKIKGKITSLLFFQCYKK